MLRHPGNSSTQPCEQSVRAKRFYSAPIVAVLRAGIVLRFGHELLVHLLKLGCCSDWNSVRTAIPAGTVYFAIRTRTVYCSSARTVCRSSAANGMFADRPRTFMFAIRTRTVRITPLIVKEARFAFDGGCCILRFFLCVCVCTGRVFCFARTFLNIFVL